MGLAEKICIFISLLQGVCCRDYGVYLPEKIEALSGSCVIIKCRFEIIKAEDEQLTKEKAIGFWLKDNKDKKNEVFNSRDPKPNFEGKMSEKLHEKNCTTIFYNVGSKHNSTFLFRIESGKLKYTYTHNTSMINVLESPVKPRVQLSEEQKELQEPQEVLEGRSLSLRCSAETLCSSLPPTLTWSSTLRILPSESSKLQELIISDLNFTADSRHHNVTFTCSINYQLQDNNKTANSSITLNVQYSPKNTSVFVFPSDPVLEGSSVTLTCRSEANPALLNYSWSRESEGRLEMLQTGDTLTIYRTELSDRGVYICTAQNKHGNQMKSVLLDIHYVPQISNSSCSNSTDVTVCFCEVNGNPFPEVQWLLSGHPVSNSSDTLIREEAASGLRSSISLHQSYTHRNTLQCVGRNIHGSADQLFIFILFAQKEWFNILSLLVGVVVGTLLMAILWAITLLFKRNNKTQSEDKTVLKTDWADSVNNGGEPFYANKIMMPSAKTATQNDPEQLHYSTINLNHSKAESDEIRGLSSLTTEYAVIQHSGRKVPVKETKTSEVSSVPNEDPIYQVPHKTAARSNRKQVMSAESKKANDSIFL